MRILPDVGCSGFRLRLLAKIMTVKRHNQVARRRARWLPAMALGLAAASTFGAMVHAMHPSEITTGGQVIRTDMLQALLPTGEFRNVKVMQIELAPDAEAPHHRDDVAILAYVLEGKVERDAESGTPIKHEQGHVWWQSAGTHVHLIARNSSKARRARLLAVFIEKNGGAGE